MEESRVLLATLELEHSVVKSELQSVKQEWTAELEASKAMVASLTKELDTSKVSITRERNTLRAALVTATDDHAVILQQKDQMLALERMGYERKEREMVAKIAELEMMMTAVGGGGVGPVVSTHRGGRGGGGRGQRGTV